MKTYIIICFPIVTTPVYCLRNICTNRLFIWQILGSFCIIDNTPTPFHYLGKMIGKSIQCEYGMNCTDHPQICALSRPACTYKCGKCNEGGGIACVGPNTFALCYGGSTPSTMRIDCPESGVCNNYLEGDFCGPPTPVSFAHFREY